MAHKIAFQGSTSGSNPTGILEVSASNPLPVTGGSTQYTEDTASAGGESLTLAGVVRQDTIASSTSTDGDYANLKSDSLGALYGREVYAPTAEDNTVGCFKVEERFSYANITTATTTTVKSGAGFVHAITVNTTAAGAITIYDNTAGSGTKIGTLKASVAEQTFILNVTFGTGLTIVTAAASDITVSWR